MHSKTYRPMFRNILGTKLISQPNDLSAITRIDRAGEAPAADGGLSPQAVDAIWHAVEGLYRSRSYPAVTFCLRRRGEILLNRSIGHATGNGPDAVPGMQQTVAEPDTPVCLFSASKAMTAMLVHKLAEEGGVDLDARVTDYIPEFGQNGKEQVTVSRVLSHRGGFATFDVENRERKPETLLDWDRCIELICQSPSNSRGRPRQAYHALTGGFILAEIIQRVTGGSLADYLDSRFRKPLGMRYFTYGIHGEDRQRMALNYATGIPLRYPLTKIAEKVLTVPFDAVIEASNGHAFTQAVVPAANLYASAEEVSRFYQMLLNGGEYAGQQILAPDTVARAIRPVSGPRLDGSLKIPMRYSEGMMLGMNPFGLYGPMCGHVFGHLGFMNILGWADPERDIAASLMTTGKGLLGRHLLAFERLLASIAWQCREH